MERGVNVINLRKKTDRATVKLLYTLFFKKVTDIVLDLKKTPIVWEGFPKDNSESI